jgi:hypothetical protein
VTVPTGFTQPTPNDMCLPYQSRVDRFYYYINPVITRVQPHSGPVEGNTRITIEGSGFYPELLSISSCYHGVTTFQSAQRIGFLPLANVTDYATTVTKVVCPLTNPAAVGLNEMFFSMNSQQPAINRPIPGYKDRRSNRFARRLSSDVTFFNLPAFSHSTHYFCSFSMLSTGFFFYPPPRLDGIMPSGTSSDNPEDRTITM